MDIIPAGTHMVDAVAAPIRPKSGTTLQIDGTLQALPCSQRISRVVLLDGVSDVNVVLNGQIIGDHLTHANATDDNGFGICILNSRNVTVAGKGIVKSCAGDGVYIDQACKNIKLRDFTSTGNRRQGMSVIDVDGLDVDGCRFINTAGTPPGAGVDIEPDLPVGGNPGGTQSVRNIKFRRCVMTGNKGASLLICCPRSARSNIDIDCSNVFDRHPIDGTDGTVPFWSKWFYYATRSYALYPRCIKI